MAEHKDKRQYNVSKEFSYVPKERTTAQKKHFFLDGKLYKKLHQDRSLDILSAWSFSDNKIVQFSLSDAKVRMKNAYDTSEVARMVNRQPAVVQTYVIKGNINSPIRIYAKGRNARGKPFDVMKWSDDDIIALHEYLLYNGAGRPRKDGFLYSGTRLPTRQELLAILRNQPMFYMKTSSGEMIPVWSAYNEV